MVRPRFWHTGIVRIVAAAAGLLLIVSSAALAIWIWWKLPDFRSRGEVGPGWPASVLVLAGDGVAGTRDGRSWEARFEAPFGVAVAAGGDVYVADAGINPRIRRISPDGNVVTIAGSGAGFADGAGGDAQFSTPSALAIDQAGAIYVADTGNNAVRRVTADGRVTTIAKGFNGPIGVAVDPTGRVIVSDTYNDCIRAIDSHGALTTVAGACGAPGAADGAGAEARFNTPCGVAADSSGTIYVADTGNGLVRTIDRTGAVSTPSWSTLTGLERPIGIAVGPDGNIYVTDERGWIVEIASGASPRIVAGSMPGFRDGPGAETQFRSPAGIAVAEQGRLIVADLGNALVRVVAAPQRHRFRLPPAARIDPHFDAEAFGFQPLLWPVAPIEGPHEIAGTIGEARGGDGSERLHLGVDVRAEQGTFVRAVRDGIVSSPLAIDGFNTLTESLRIGPVAYVHVRAGRERRNELVDTDRFVPTFDGGKLAGIRVKRGARFTVGDPIGTVNAFNHVHLNVGWPGEEYNPLTFRLVQFEDNVAPTIASGGVQLYDSQGEPLRRRERGRIVVSGAVQVVVDAWDQADGNRPQRRLGLFELGYQVLARDGSPAPGFETVRRTMRFDRVALSSDPARLVYASGSGIPFYRRGRTRFLYVVTNTLKDGVATQRFWDTAALPAGDYIVRAWVSDVRGNSATRDLPVTIASDRDTLSSHP
jgi:sugar lactone lactonase YvrE